MLDLMLESLVRGCQWRLWMLDDGGFFVCVFGKALVAHAAFIFHCT